MEHALDAFMPHGMCYLWRTDILLLHVLSDLVIALAYFSIPAALVAFLRRRPDVQFSFVFWLFIGFILSCGVTHLLSIVVTWEPLYVLQGIAKAVTAIISAITAIVLWPLIPRFVAIPSPTMLEQRNTEIEALNGALERRVESLSTLSGGVAHDFNNLLTVIVGYTSELRASREDAVDDGAVRGAADDELQALTAIEQAAERATALCRRMLGFSGRGHFVLASEPAEGLVERGIELAHAAPDVVEIEAGLPEIAVSAEQVHELIAELVDNAREAVGDDEGAVRLGVRSEALDDARLAASVTEHRLQPGPAVVLEISDTGEGMSAEVRARMFEPYFSTRFTGRGLGLAAVYGIVRGHGAALFVDSRPEKDTSVCVAFAPATQADDQFRERHDAGARARILIVDDEPEVLRLARSYCERLGFEVVATTDPEEALNALRSEPEGFRAVLLDFLMPKMTGSEVLEQIRSFSEVDVFLASGFARGELADPRLRERLAGFLHKPYRQEDLRRLLLDS